MEISKTLAERTLREHRGDLVAALITLTNWWQHNVIFAIDYFSITEICIIW